VQSRQFSTHWPKEASSFSVTASTANATKPSPCWSAYTAITHHIAMSCHASATGWPCSRALFSTSVSTMVRTS
jgi:hypothetical protein